ncbi:MAG: six-hairpin glycosidase, partial [Prevotella sp.]|nr:six-hairpin glycosidase [Prevotella sp.]
FLPWYVNMPDDDSLRYAPAWLQLLDSKGFEAPFGMTTAERRHPLFRKRYKPGKPTCEWDGAIWPFATSQTLTALANVYDSSPQLAAALPDSMFFHHLKKYTESQYRRGRPYIGEYLDEKDGQWLMGDRERSRYYNHSTYCDLIITGLCGLRPSMSAEVTVRPHIPATWDYFLLTGVPYHGRLVTIIYDKYGDRYHLGKGVRVIL